MKTKPELENQPSRKLNLKKGTSKSLLANPEHDETVRRLVLVGSLISEAEQIIAARKAAFNRASQEFK
jgi:hypothetical protein